MINLSIPLLKEKFDYFNKQLFKGTLPPIQLKISRTRSKAGCFSFSSKKNIVGKEEISDLSISISECFDFEENELEDVLIHEMIHYYIFHKGLRNVRPHGKEFKYIMNEFNRRYGRHIVVSFRRGEVKADTTRSRRRVHIVALITFKDGHTGLKVLTRTGNKIIQYYNAFKAYSPVSNVELFATDDVYFDSYPHSCSLRYHPIDGKEEVMAHLKYSVRIECDGKSLKVV